MDSVLNSDMLAEGTCSTVDRAAQGSRSGTSRAMRLPCCTKKEPIWV